MPTCENCGDSFDDDGGAVFPIKKAPWYCKSCFSRREKERVIEVHSYKPKPIFQGSGRMFGLEIEVELAENVHRTNMARMVKKSCPIKCYIKEDASLYNGFEIVTHPASLSMIKSEAMSTWIDMVASINIVAPTASIHIHAQKKKNDDLYLRLLTEFYMNHKKHLIMFSGRRALSSIQTFAKFDRQYFIDKNHHGVFQIREETIEHRLFGNDIRNLFNYLSFVAITMDAVDSGSSDSYGQIDYLASSKHDKYFYHSINRMTDEEFACV